MTPNQAPSEYVKKVAEQLGDWFDSRLGTNGVNYDRLLLQHKEAIAIALQAERDKLDEAAKVIEPFADLGCFFKGSEPSNDHVLMGGSKTRLTVGHCRAAADWLAKHKPV